MSERLLRTLFVSLGFFLISSFSSASAGEKGKGLLLSPYLQALSDTSIAVAAETGANSSVRVEYGAIGEERLMAEGGWTDTTTAETIVHTVHLGGLKPGTAYEYRVIVGDTATAFRTFATPVPPGTPFRFAWMADTRANQAVHDSIAVRVRNAHPAFLLFGGDTGPTSSYESFKEYFFRPCMMDLIAEVPFYNATGNHEGWRANTRAFTKAPPSASASQAYYSFDAGDVHVVVVNNELPITPGSPQYQFIKEDLASSRRPWKIVASHRPAYCAGGHGDDGDMVRLTTDLFEPNGVQVVLSGHTHLFQHNIVNGIHHLIVGSAGAPLYTPSSDWYTVKSAKEYNFAIADVSPDRLTITVYNERGVVLDNVEMHKKVCNCFE